MTERQTEFTTISIYRETADLVDELEKLTEQKRVILMKRAVKLLAAEVRKEQQPAPAPTANPQ